MEYPLSESTFWSHFDDSQHEVALVDKAASAVGITVRELQDKVSESSHLSLSADRKHVNLFPVEQLLPNFGSCCAGWLSGDQLPQLKSQMYQIVSRYTGNDIYIALNLGLALDEANVIIPEAAFIQKLRFCVQELPGYTGQAPLVRGADISEKELERMKTLKKFYVPGFTSTTIKQEPPADFRKNTIIRIDASGGERVTLDIANSAYKDRMTPYPEEMEVLIQCYSLFEFVGVSEQPGQPRELMLRLLDPMNEHGEMLQLYKEAKAGHWQQVFQALDGQPHKARVCAKYWKPTSGWTMLHQAAFWGDHAAARRLLQLGADKDREAWYPRERLTAQQVKNEHGKALTSDDKSSCVLS